MKRQIRGNGFFIILVMLVLSALLFSSLLDDRGNTSYNTNNLISDIKAGKVHRVELSQEQQTPSGEVSVIFKDTANSKNVMYYSTDVQDVERMLYELTNDEEYKGTFTYSTTAMTTTPWYLVIIPYVFGLL